MGEIFQDYSRIQDFEADFPSADYNSFSDLLPDCLKTIDHLNLKLLMFCRHTTSFKSLIFKFRILEILNFRPWFYKDQTLALATY